MLTSLYFLASLIGVGWLFYWAFMAERDPDKYLDEGPFAMRDGEDMYKEFGDRYPF